MLRCVALAAALPLLAAAAPRPAAFHLALKRSAPAADAVVASLSEVRLWFTQEPQASATSIRLVDAAGELVALGDAVPDPDDATVWAAPVEGTPAPGAYTVSWRAMAADGHVVRGEFSFTVRAR